MIKLIIFDLDGTLLDTLGDLTDAVNYGLSELGYPTHSQEKICSFIGNGIPKLLRRALPQDAGEKEYEKLSSLFSECYTAHGTDNTHPYEGVSKVIVQLKNAGYLLAVASNKRDSATKVLVEHFFSGQFDIVYGKASCTPAKPAPQLIHKILKEAGVKKEECLYIGDSEVDVKTAKNARINGLFVSWGFRSTQTLIAHGAKNIIDRPEELFNYLQ